VAASLMNLGILARRQGDLARAEQHYQESIALARQLDDRNLLSWLSNNAANLASDQGDTLRARALYEESLRLRRALGNQRDVAITLNNLAGLALRDGDHLQTARLCGESLGIAREVGDRWGIALALDTLASLALEQGDPRRAIVLFTATDALRQAVGSSSQALPPADRDVRERRLAEARRLLPSDELATLMEQAGVMSLDQVIASALSSASSLGSPEAP
jgi:tetratricopeptide (TPR) repeat protein